MAEHEVGTPDILFMPEPERILEAVSCMAEAKEFIENFHKSLDCDCVDEIIKKMSDYISVMTGQFSGDPEIIRCYKNEQQSMSDEYFYIQRTDSEIEKRFVLNAFVIARDILVNNKIDNYLEQDQVKLTLEAMASLLSHTLSRGDLNECE